MIVFLIVSALISAIATGVIIFSGLQKPEQKTSIKSQASIPTAILTVSPTPKPVVTTGATIKLIISPYITATTSADKKSVFINFFKISGSKSALYKMNYSADNGQKSAQGNIVFKLGEDKTSREIILGVCSGSVCTYDSGVKNIKIEVTFTQKDDTISQITYPYSL